MEIKAFLIQFEKTLTQGGLSSDDARKHTVNVAKSLSAHDRDRISSFTTYAEVSEIANRYLRNLHAPSQTVSEPAASSSISAAPDSFSDTVTVKRAESAGAPSRTLVRTLTPEYENDGHKTSRFSSHASDDYEATRKIDKAARYIVPKVKLTPEGKKRYSALLFKKSPILCAVYISIGVVSFTVYALIALLITVLLAALVVSTVVGGIGSLAGLIYGVIKLFSVVPEGLYEIGFAIVIAAVSLALCICIYNLAVRIVPVLWKSFTEYLRRNVVYRLRLYFNQMRKEANRE